MQASFVLLAAGYVLAFAAAACVPDVALALLSDPRVLKHEAVLLALNEVQRNLSALYKNTTRDGLSVAIVCIAVYHFLFPSPTTFSLCNSLRGNRVTGQGVYNACFLGPRLKPSANLYIQ